MKWYFCTFFYAKKPDKMKEGTTGVILDNKRNTFSFSNHVVTFHKNIISPFFSFMDG